MTEHDKFWKEATGGYGTPFDPRPLLTRLEAGEGEGVWPALWDELHHQGDVGTASYAAVPELVRVYRKLGVLDWNVYAIVAVIDLARDQGANPELPKILQEDYFQAIQELAQIGQSEIAQAKEPETIRSILAVMATAKGLRVHARFLIEFSEDELLEMDPLTQGRDR